MWSASEWLPYLLLALPAGLLVDRWSRRRIMVSADLLRAVLLGVIPVGAALGVMSIPLVVTVTVAVGCLTVFFDLAYLSAPPWLVDRDQLPAANRALEGMAGVARVAGPALGGLAVAVLRPSGVILLDALSFLASAACVSRVRRPETRRPQPDVGLITALRMGLTQVRHSRYVRPMVIFLSVNNLIDQAFLTALLLLVVRQLQWSSRAVGLLIAVHAAGFLLGAMASPVVGRRLGVGRTVCGASLLGGLGFFVVGLSTGPAAPFLAPAGLLVSGLGTGLLNLQSLSLRQAVTPPELMGRVNAVVRTATSAGIALGALLGGLASQLAGGRAVLLAAGVCSVLVTLVPAFSAVLPLRGQPDVEPAHWTTDPVPAATTT